MLHGNESWTIFCGKSLNSILFEAEMNENISWHQYL